MPNVHHTGERKQKRVWSMRAITWEVKEERWRSTKMIKAIKQFIKDRALFKKAAQDLDNKELQAKAKYAFEHREDTILGVIDYIAIVSGILILAAIVWCWV